jgi:hypothetical protein
VSSATAKDRCSPESVMARLPRVVAIGGPHHVTQRANGRSFILERDTDRQVYLDLLNRSLALHDVAMLSTNGITIGSYFNPSLSPATSRALIQSNNFLMQTGGYQGAKEKLFFGVVNAFQWASHIF